MNAVIESTDSPIYRAARHWRDRCLLDGGSVFLPSAEVWTPKAVAEFEKRFVVGFLSGDEKFYDKLERQMEGASAASIRLAAEMLWLMFLFPEDVILAPRKSADVRKVWGWSGTELPADHPMLAPEVLSGIASVGTFYNTGRYVELQYLVQRMKEWVGLDRARREKLLANPELFAEWLDESDPTGNRMVRHIILHLLFPGHFIAIASSGHKRRIVRALASRVGDTNSYTKQQMKSLPWLEIDRSLRKLHETMKAEHDGPVFHFYLDEIKPLWDKPAAPAKPRVTKPVRMAVRDEPADMGTEATDLFMNDDEVARIRELLATRKNVVLQGPPGVGKSFVARRIALMVAGSRSDRIHNVQFHQSYSYEDFVQGYRPTGTGFERRDGALMLACREAAQEPETPLVLVIDEINRGNLSRIFGEAMLLLEADKRGPEWGVRLTYSTTDEQNFHIPPNLYVIGLMNTADRSLAMVDYALRRRFAYIDIESKINSEAFAQFLEEAGALAELIERIQENVGALNALIGADIHNLGRGYLVGHSYFCTLPADGVPDDAWYLRIVEHDLIPLINEYWFDQPDKVAEASSLLKR